jgi:hypothetical protein
VKTVLLTLLAACTLGPVAPHDHEIVASIERRACYGACPIYSLTVYRDGEVEYFGEQFVIVHGNQRAHVGPATIELIDRAFARANYFALAETYTTTNMTDMPYVLTTYSDGRRTKSIEHYIGDRSAPPALEAVEDRLDALLHVERWVGTREQRRAMRE